MVMLSGRSFTSRDRLVGELHYACKAISDEAFGYVLAVAKSFAVTDDLKPGDRLVNQTRCIITGPDEARLNIVWSFDGTRFLSSTYTRHVGGGWTSDRCVPGDVWLVKIEAMYQQKLKEIEAAVLSEV
jgi:hypothetical protein